ncbi:MAG: DUF5723 family protein [Candidatus Zixiibacteriota bacterium]
MNNLRYHGNNHPQDRAETMNITKIIIITGLILLTLAATQAFAGGHSSARSVAMGKAYTALAKGPDAGKYNPANLGLRDYRRTGLEIVGVGANISNNAFTLNDYNEYSGALLTTEDKDYILGKIPQEGLKLAVDAEATVMALSTGAYAFNVTGIGIADVNMSRDLFELILNGNTFADTINVNGSYSDLVSYASAGLSYGMPLFSSGTRQLAVGATVKYIRGIAIEEVVELEGLAATFATGFEGEGHMVVRTATGGSGYAVDLGAAFKINNSYTVGACLKNFVSHITWNNETEEHGYDFSFDTVTVDNMDEDFVVSDDYSVPIDNFSTDLPSTLTVGIAKISGKLQWAVDWEQGFNRNTGVSSKPLISTGLEYSFIGLLPLRAGFTTGGDRNTTFSFGSGFNISPIYLDYALVTGSSFSGYSSKGVNFAVSLGILL